MLLLNDFSRLRKESFKCFIVQSADNSHHSWFNLEFHDIDCMSQLHYVYHCPQQTMSLFFNDQKSVTGIPMKGFCIISLSDHPWLQMAFDLLSASMIIKLVPHQLMSICRQQPRYSDRHTDRQTDALPWQQFNLLSLKGKFQRSTIWPLCLGFQSVSQVVPIQVVLHSLPR